MTHRPRSLSLVTLLGLGMAALGAPGSTSLAQQPSPSTSPPFTSRPIMVAPVTDNDTKEMVLLSVQIVPGGAVPLHTHPGDCVGSVVEGSVELHVQGQPVQRLSAGEAYRNLRGTVHGFKNVGETPARLLNTLMADKGAPRVQFVPPAAR